MRDYTALLEAGNKAQMEKLKRNGHKEGFEDIEIDKAYCRINDKLKELRDELAFEILAIPDTIRNYKKIRHKAADIANFAHMIILACDKELKPS